MAKFSKKQAKDLTLVVEGTKLTVPVRFESVSMSKAGTGGVALSNACRDHRCLMKSPKVCPTHALALQGDAREALKLLTNGLGAGSSPEAVEAAVKRIEAGIYGNGELEDTQMMKAKKLGGDEYVYIEPAVIEALKPIKQETVRLIQILDAANAGWFRPADELTQLLPKTQVVQPVDTGDGAGLKRYAALARGLLGDGRVGIIQVVGRGKLWYGLLRATEAGFLVVHELYKPEHTKAILVPPVPQLSEAEAKAYMAKGAELAADRVVDLELLNEDPHLRKVEAAIEAAADGKVLDLEPDVEPEVEQTEDLLALI